MTRKLNRRMIVRAIYKEWKRKLNQNRKALRNFKRAIIDPEVWND